MSDTPAGAPRPHVDAARVEVHLPGSHERGEEMSLAQRLFYRLVRAVVVFIAHAYFRVRVSGAERIPSHGPFILSPVHRSNLDTPVIAAVSRRRLRYMGKESLWKSRFGGWFLTTAGGFRGHPTVRSGGAAAVSRRCLSVVPNWCSHRARGDWRLRGRHAQGLQDGVPPQAHDGGR